MSRWVLVCPRCKKEFIHSQVSDAAIQEAFRNSHGLVARPHLELDVLTCPHCNMKSWYQDFDLIYSEDDADPTAKGKGA
jgi:uncharacterized protein YbaR (Trm112 family)